MNEFQFKIPAIIKDLINRGFAELTIHYYSNARDPNFKRDLYTAADLILYSYNDKKLLSWDSSTGITFEEALNCGDFHAYLHEIGFPGA